MHILIAPNAFKNSISAAGAARSIFRGLQQSGLDFNADLFPVADGGDGTAALLEERLEAISIPVSVANPLGTIIDTHFGWLEKDQIAIIELANASGLRLLSPSSYNPRIANTRGTGQTICRAIELGAKEIILAIGGSATVDGGTGILTELGMRLLDSNQQVIHELPARLASVTSIDAGHLDSRIKNLKFTILCDVSNPLLGENGAARIFGPQKGAGTADIQLLEEGLKKFCECSQRITGKNMDALKYGGAAGGVAAGLATWLDASLVNGIRYFLEITSFEKFLDKADLVITGEGRIDLQTLQGKAPMGVAEAAKEKGIRVWAMAGQISDRNNKQLREYFDELIEINPLPLDIHRAMLDAEKNLEQAARLLGGRLKSF
jgi:glycerate 2-kinase